MPQPIKLFLAQFISLGNVLEDAFYNPFEKTRVISELVGAYELKKPKLKIFLLLSYVGIKVLLNEIFINVNEKDLNATISATSA